MINIEIRPECKKDASAIDLVLQDAYNTTNNSILVNRIRASQEYVPELSLVALFENEIIGYILLSEIKICSKNVRKTSLALAPIAVKKAFQNRGAGSLLMLAALDKASLLGYSSVIVLEHHDYFLRFGFEPATTWEIESPFHKDSDNFMGIELIPKGLSNFPGKVVFPLSWKL